MKLKTLLLSLAVFAGISVNAQDWSTDVYKYGEQYPGYYIDSKGKKTEGFIKYQNRYSMQNNIVFFAEKGNKKSKEKIKTSTLKEYKVADKLYHCIHYSGGLLAKPIKGNLVVKEGCITQYVWYNRAENYMTMQKGPNETQEEFMERMYPPTTVYLKAGEEETKTLDKFAIKFAKKMSAWIADNKELSSKVANKEKGYGMLKILDIIEQYNEECK